MNKKQHEGGEVLLYKTDDGGTRIEVRMVGETVWLSLNQMAELFQRDKSVIAKHIKNTFEEAELDENRTVAKFATVQNEGTREVSREIEHFNLDVIISVGYRVKSKRGTQFRIWATQRLREYLVKGFAMDDKRLKRGGGGNYFDELLARIRDIRSSERVFWRKVLDIYSTSIDYDADSNISKQFFATVQNKMHWAAHGRTAAEIIKERADANQPNMGLTSWTGSHPKKSDAGVAKNYLVQDELNALNLIVSAYLDFAELQVQGRKPMYMKDWITKLDGFLQLSERDVLTHVGKVSHDDAMKRAGQEYEKFLTKQNELPATVDQDFERAVDKIKKLSGQHKKKSDHLSKKLPPKKRR
jgi:hypothetical protein